MSLSPTSLRILVAVLAGLTMSGLARAAEARDGNYFGTAVYCAARISARAPGGQVLVSAATAGLVAGSGGCPERVDLGLHDLKGLDRATQLFEVRVARQETSCAVLGVTAAVVGHVPSRRGCRSGWPPDQVDHDQVMTDGTAKAISGGPQPATFHAYSGNSRAGVVVWLLGR